MNEPRHKQGKMYDNEEDRRNGLILNQKEYMQQTKMKCEIM